MSQGNTLAQDDHPLLRSYDDWDYADDDTTAGDDTTAADEKSYVELLSENSMYIGSLWRGFFSGLYSVSKKGMVPKPTRECLGTWIADDINFLQSFRDSMLNDYWNVSISEYEKAWNSAGDLMFKNFDACNFKAVLEDVTAYCKTEVDDPSKIDPSPYDKDAEPVA